MKHPKRWLAVAALTTTSVLGGLVGMGGAEAVSPQVGTFCANSGTVVGAGATFQTNVQATFKADYQDRCNQLGRAPGSLTYNGGGSGAGRSQFCSGTVQYGASDEPFDVAEKASCHSGAAFNQFPVALGAVTISYNAPTGCALPSPLNLTAAQVSGIFKGTITNWSSIVSTCSAALSRVVRSDSSGTTYVFKDFLSKRDSSWATYKTNANNTVWPGTPAPLTGSGNGGVASVVNSTDGSVGYVELSSAFSNGLTWANVENSAGTFESPVEADGAANCTTAAATAVLPTSTDGDWSGVSITDGLVGYPICSFTYLLIWTDASATIGASAGQEQMLADLVDIAIDAKTQADLRAKHYGFLPHNALAVDHAGALSLH
jgi:phosphate transport system substrate-binding protein